VDKLVVAKVDADVGEGAAHGVEEHQIAGTELILADGFARLAHFLGTARQNQAQAFAEDMADEARAIKAGFR
jgi:hypothetical protein